MEESLPKEKPEVELKEDEDNQGGIGRRLRDRDLLRKRKAELEEKETYQLESKRKRARREEKSGTGKRGRPKKTEPPLELPVLQEEPGQLPPEGPAVVVVPEPTLVIPSPTLIPFLPVFPDPLESQPGNVPAGPAPIPFLASASVPVLTPASSSNDAGPAPVPPMPALAPMPAPLSASVSPVASVSGLVSAPAQETAPATISAPFFFPTSVSVSTSVPSSVSFPGPSLTPDKALDAGPISAPPPPPAPTLFSTLDSAQAPVLALPSQAEAVSTESQGKDALDQVLIEDLGPDEKEDISFSQDKKAIDQDTSQESFLSRPDENGTFLNSPPPPQEYRPGY